MKAYRRSRGIAPLIFILGTRWWLVVNITTQPLYLQDRTRYSRNRALGGLQGLSGRSVEENKYLDSVGSFIVSLCRII
jgi:hypothetical protein